MLNMLAVAALAALPWVPAQAQSTPWPDRPVRFVVPFPPGGSSDIVMRMLSDPLARALGQPIIVENRGGAGGAIGTAEVARAKADGYTVLLGTDAMLTFHLAIKDLSFDIQRDFIPVTLVAQQPIAIAVHQSLPVHSIKELIAYAKLNPKLSYAAAGTATGQHMSGELFKKRADIDMIHIPYKGGAQAVTDFVGGQVPVAVIAAAPLIPFHKSGRIRILAFTSKERFFAMPDIPTLNESGFPGFDTSQWLGIFVPKGTPANIVTRLHMETAKVLTLPEVKARLAEAAHVAVGNSPSEFPAVVRTDIEAWNTLGAELGIKPE